MSSPRDDVELCFVGARYAWGYWRGRYLLWDRRQPEGPIGEFSVEEGVEGWHRFQALEAEIARDRKGPRKRASAVS